MELYITRADVQTQRVKFFNMPRLRVVKTWYTFHKFRNRSGRSLSRTVASGFRRKSAARKEGS
jgi:hypothetical protein